MNWLAISGPLRLHRSAPVGNLPLPYPARAMVRVLGFRSPHGCAGAYQLSANQSRKARVAMEFLRAGVARRDGGRERVGERQHALQDVAEGSACAKGYSARLRPR